MADYKYIEVAQPDRGLANHIPATDISPRHCSDCQNVFFEDGAIKKRFGYGAAKSKTNTSGAAATMTEEVLEMAMFDESLANANPSRRVLAITKSYLLQWDDANARWEMDEAGVSHDCNDATYPNAKITAACSVTFQTTGIGISDIYFTTAYPTDTSDHTYLVKISTASTPDIFQINKDGAGYGDATNCGDTYTDAGTGVSIRFGTTTGHTLNDVWTVKYDYANKPVLSAVTTPAPPVGTGNTYSLKIVIPAGYDCSSGYYGMFFTVSDEDASGDLQNVDTVSYWMYHSKSAGEDIVRQVTITACASNDDESSVQTPETGDYYNLAAGQYPDSTPITDAYDGQWNYYEWYLSEAEQAILSDAGWSGKRRVAFGIRDVNPGTYILYICKIRFSSRGGAGSASAIDTTDEVTTSRLIYGTVNSTVDLRLYYTNLNGYVRFVDSGANQSQILLNADDYNTAISYHRARALSGFGSRLHLLGTIEEDSGDDKYHLLRDRWCDAGDMDVWDTGTADYEDTVQSPDQIVNAISHGAYDFIYKESSISRTTWVAGEATVFDRSLAYSGDGLVAAKLLMALSANMYFVGQVGDFYRYPGVGDPDPTSGLAVRTEIKAALDYSNGQYRKRSFFLYIKEKNLLLILIPTASAYPDKAWVYDFRYDRWTKWLFSDGTSTNITAGTSYEGLRTANLVRGTQFGNSSGDFYEIDFTATNDGAKAIDANWDSKDFANPQKGRTEYTDWGGVYFEAKGASAGDTITVSYSIDNGTSWTACTAIALTATWARYRASFNINSQLLRIRFANSTISQSFQVRWFSLLWKEGAPY